MKPTLTLKIMAGFAVTALATLVLGVLAGRLLGNNSERDQAAAREGLEQVDAMADIQAKILEAQNEAAAASSRTGADKEAMVAEMAGDGTQAATAFIEFGRRNLTPEARARYRTAEGYLSSFFKLYNKVFGSALPLPDPNAPEVNFSAPDGLAQVFTLQANQQSSVAALRVQLIDDARIALDSAKESADSSLRQLLVLSVGAAVIVVLFGVWLATRITRRVRAMAAVLTQVAGGDLTARATVTGRDEVAQMGDALNTTVSTIHDVVSQIGAEADQLTAVAERASQASVTMSGSQGDTAAELVEMAHSLDTMISVFYTESASSP